MIHRILRGLGLGVKISLAVIALVVIAGPMIVEMSRAVTEFLPSMPVWTASPPVLPASVIAQMRPPVPAPAETNPDSRVTFEVASVRAVPNAPEGGRGNIDFAPTTTDERRMSFTRVTLATLLMTAFGLSTDQISGPGWLNSDKFTVIANIPAGTNAERTKLMLRNLLVERFKLALHLESKDFPLYALVVAKGGSKLKETAFPNAMPAKPGQLFGLPRDENGFFQIPPNLAGITSNGSNGLTRLSCQACSISSLIMTLGAGLGAITSADRWAPGRITDSTALTGKYDFKLEYAGGAGIGGFLTPMAAPDLQSPPGLDGPLPVGGPDIFAALEKQLGLKLEQTRGGVPVMVIDHAERVPVEN